MLAACAGRAHRIDADILGADLDVDVFGLGQNGDRSRGRMNTPLRFGRGHPLDAVHAGFEFQLGEHAATGSPR